MSPGEGSRYRLLPTASFRKDVERLEDFIVERELASETPDDACLHRFRDAVVKSLEVLSFAPHTCRRSPVDREFRELIVPFGRGGCVVLFSIRDEDVVLLAARDQHENDYR